MSRLTPTENLYYEALREAKEGLPLIKLVELKPVPPFRESNLVAANIKNLRKKLPPGFEIETVRGWGYKLVEMEESKDGVG